MSRSRRDAKAAVAAANASNDNADETNHTAAVAPVDDANASAHVTTTHSPNSKVGSPSPAAANTGAAANDAMDAEATEPANHSANSPSHSPSPSPESSAGGAVTPPAPVERSSQRTRAKPKSSATPTNAAAAPSPSDSSNTDAEPTTATGRASRAAKTAAVEKLEGKEAPVPEATATKRAGARVKKDATAASAANAKGNRKKRGDDDVADDSGGDGDDGEAEENGEDLFCVCRQPYDVKRFMIGCDSCDGWFHARCVNITVALAQKLQNFVCPPCRKNGMGVQASKEQQQAEMETAQNGPVLDDEEGDAISNTEPLNDQSNANKNKSVGAKRKDKRRDRSPSPSARRAATATPIELSSEPPKKKQAREHASTPGLTVDDRRGASATPTSGLNQKDLKRRRDEKVTKPIVPPMPPPRAAIPDPRRRDAVGKPPLPLPRAAPAVDAKATRKQAQPVVIRRTGTGRAIHSPSWRNQGEGEDMDDLQLEPESHLVSATMPRSFTTSFNDRSTRDRGDRDYHHYSHHSRIDWVNGEVLSSDDDEDIEGVYITSEDEEQIMDSHVNLDTVIAQHLVTRDDFSRMPSKQGGYKFVHTIEEETGSETSSHADAETTTKPLVAVSIDVNSSDANAAASNVEVSISPASKERQAQAARDAEQDKAAEASVAPSPSPSAADMKLLRKSNDSLYKRTLLVDARSLSSSFDDLGESLLQQALHNPPQPLNEMQQHAAAAVAAAAAKVNEARAELIKLESETAAKAVAEAEANGKAVTAALAAAGGPIDYTSFPQPPPIPVSPSPEAKTLSEKALIAHQAYLDILKDPELLNPLPLHKGSSPALVDHSLVLHMEANKTKVECALLQLEQKRRIYLSGLAYSARMSALTTAEVDMEEDADDEAEEGVDENDVRERKRMRKEAQDALIPSPSVSAAIAASAYPLTTCLSDVMVDIPDQPTPTATDKETTNSVSSSSATVSLAPSTTSPTSASCTIKGKDGKFDKSKFGLSEDMSAVMGYRHLLPGLFPFTAEEDPENPVDIYEQHTALMQSELMASRSAPHGVLSLGRLSELSLEFLQCPSCHGLIPATGFHSHTSNCSSSTLTADPNIQQPPPFNQNYPPQYASLSATAAEKLALQNNNVTQGLLPLPAALQLPLTVPPRKRAPYKNAPISRELLHANVASNTARQQAYACALHDIDGRLSRFTSAKWDLGTTTVGQDALTTICACPMVEIGSEGAHDPLKPIQYCKKRKTLCTDHLLWEDLWKSNMEQQYFVLCRRLELLKCELECVYARIHDRAIVHGLQAATLTAEEQAAQVQAQAQAQAQVAAAQARAQAEAVQAQQAQLQQIALMQQNPQLAALPEGVHPNVLTVDGVPVAVDPSQLAEGTVTVQLEDGQVAQLTAAQHHALLQQQQQHEAALMHQHQAQQAAAQAQAQAQAQAAAQQGYVLQSHVAVGAPLGHYAAHPAHAVPLHPGHPEWDQSVAMQQQQLYYQQQQQQAQQAQQQQQQGFQYAYYQQQPQPAYQQQQYLSAEQQFLMQQQAAQQQAYQTSYQAAAVQQQPQVLPVQ